VEAALRSAQQLAKKVPRDCGNGVAIFAGGGHAELFLPPEAVPRALYRCGKSFELGPLEGMLDKLQGSKPCVAVVAVDGKEAVIAAVEEEGAITVLATLQSHTRGRCRRGGQSAPRFARAREGGESRFVAAVAEALAAHFLGDDGQAKNPLGDGPLLGVVLAGPADVKRQVAACPGLPRALPVLAVCDTGAAGRGALAEALARSQGAVRAARDREGTGVLKSFLDALEAGGEAAAPALYGSREVSEAVRAHAAALVLATERVAAAAAAPAPEGGEAPCASLLEWLRARCAESGATLHALGEASEEEAHFAALGGLGATLRWPFVPGPAPEEEDASEDQGTAQGAEEQAPGTSAHEGASEDQDHAQEAETQGPCAHVPAQ